MRLCPRSVHPSVLQQILAKDSHSHEDDIANGLWMTLARQICTCWTKIERRQSLINSNREKKKFLNILQPIRIMQRWSFQLCFAETAKVCSRTCQIPKRRVFLSIPLKPSASVHGSTAPGSRQPKDYPAGPLCLWWLVWHWSLCLSWHCLYRFHGSHSKESDTNIIRILICVVVTRQ